jgi:hypothetical protein
VEDYGPFAIATAPASVLSAELEPAAGLQALPYPGAFDLDVGGAVIDYRLSDRERSERSPALITQPRVIRRILAHLAAPAPTPSQGRAPPPVVLPAHVPP